MLEDINETAETGAAVADEARAGDENSRSHYTVQATNFGRIWSAASVYVRRRMFCLTFRKSFNALVTTTIRLRLDGRSTKVINVTVM